MSSPWPCLSKMKICTATQVSSWKKMDAIAEQLPLLLFFLDQGNILAFPHQEFLMKMMTWIPRNLSFHYIHCSGQFTPKMTANAEPRLLSSLVWIDQYNECNGMTSFMEFMIWWYQYVIFRCHMTLQTELMRWWPGSWTDWTHETIVFWRTVFVLMCLLCLFFLWTELFDRVIWVFASQG